MNSERRSVSNWCRLVTVVLVTLAVGNVYAGESAAPHDYDIVYVRAPRYGDERNQSLGG